MSSLIAQRSELAGAGGPIRVMIVDDSAVIRGFLRRWLDAEPLIEIVAACGDGAQAVNKLLQCRAEVTVLDVEMPILDGLNALPQLLRLAPDMQIVMASTLTQRNAEISLRALSMGAADYVAKPEAMRGDGIVDTFRDELIRKILALGTAARGQKGLPAPSAEGQQDVRQRIETVTPVPSTPISLRPASRAPVTVLAIGSSTGGPQALQGLLEPLVRQGVPNVPILITQHMPPTFTTILADHLQRSLKIPGGEAVDGNPVRAGHFYLAPGDHHMMVTGTRDEAVIRLTQEPPENFCRPAVDPLFRSVADVYGSGALCAVLTGMGHDGREGARTVVAAGGTILAQDADTSVVWGMPGAVAAAGLCSAVDNLPTLKDRIARMLQGGGV